MEAELKDQDVLLVKEKGNNKVNVVTGLDEDGNPKTVAPTKTNEPGFMKLDKHGSALENFFTNFLRQSKEPTHFGFFKVPAENIEATSKVVSEMLKEEGANKAFLDKYRVEPKGEVVNQSQNQPSTTREQTKNQEYHPIDENRIDWKQLERLGVSREVLERTGSLEAMLNWRKSPVLIPISPKFDEITLRTDARLSFRETAEGNYTAVVHAIRKEPELNHSFYGHTFTNEEKKDLQLTGNLGKQIELKIPNTSDSFMAYVSVDKLTNELVSLRADKLKIPNNIKGVELSEPQKQELKEGKAVYLEGMTAKNGNSFNASVQINADRRGIEFLFLEQHKQNQQQDNANNTVSISGKLGGVVLSEKQQETLKDGSSIYVEGMIDAKGQSYNAYVKVNPEEKKLDFFRWNPDKKQNVTPDNSGETQVAVNSQGKNNEATKHSTEPLKSGQTQPTEMQQQELAKNEEPKKAKGVKM